MLHLITTTTTTAESIELIRSIRSWAFGHIQLAIDLTAGEDGMRRAI
jgi:hypothetical protein